MKPASTTAGGVRPTREHNDIISTYTPFRAESFPSTPRHGAWRGAAVVAQRLAPALSSKRIRAAAAATLRNHDKHARTHAHTAAHGHPTPLSQKRKGPLPAREPLEAGRTSEIRLGS